MTTTFSQKTTDNMNKERKMFVTKTRSHQIISVCPVHIPQKICVCVCVINYSRYHRKPGWLYCLLKGWLS